MFAQTREQIFPGIVSGLKEEMTFEIHLLKQMGVQDGFSFKNLEKNN